jgi:hypothetical protein
MTRLFFIAITTLAIISNGNRPFAEGARNPADYAGLTGPVGAPAGSKKVKMLRIEEPGVYENIIVDGEFGDFDLVRIRTDNVVLRNCTIRNGLRDAVEVYGRNVRIENCKIHHVLSGTFEQQHDAHGITGRPLNLTIRNTEIAYVSGDAIQFDPGRRMEPYPWDNVLVEHCFLWTGPLDADYAGFRKGERPGENAFDSKTHPDAPRARITFRNILMKGWGHGQINNGAALNLKEKIQAIVDKCVFVDNDIAYRCRGTKGAAWVTTRNCTAYRTTRVFRPEYQVPNLKIFHMAYGEGIESIFDNSGGGAGEGFENHGKREAPPLAAWPYDRLPVGPVVEPGQPPSSADDAIPVQAADGWEGQP